MHKQPLDTTALSRRSLYNYEAMGQLTKVMPGFFVDSNLLPTDENLMYWINRRYPLATMNLISALACHGMTTQIPESLSISIPRHTRAPKVLVAPVTVTIARPEWLELGCMTRQGPLGPYRLTSPERTLVDCFRYRHKIGENIFLEALHIAKQKGMLNLWTLDDIAKKLRAARLITPYLTTVYS